MSIEFRVLHCGYGLDALKNVVDAYRSLSWRRLIDGLNGSSNGTVAQWVVKANVRGPRADIQICWILQGRGLLK